MLFLCVWYVFVGGVVRSVLFFFFFFFKQKTAYEMRICDWSSDVCSSDLNALLVTPQHHRLVADIDAQGLFISHFLGSGHCPPDILLSRNGHALPLLT